MMRLSPTDRRTLLEIARRSVVAVCDAPARTADLTGLSIGEVLRERAATFVTLQRDGALRGCVGALTAIEPLFESVLHNAARAATEDPRFSPVRPDEIPRLTYGVSILTPDRPVDSPDAIEIGRHGALLRKSGRRAVFLPEVASRMGWSREELLIQLCRKAGLPDNAWRENAELSIFKTLKIGEESES